MLLYAKPCVEERYAILKDFIEDRKLKMIFLIIQNPDDKASEVYIRLKKKKCEELGIETIVYNEKSSPLEIKEFIASAYKTYKLLGYTVGIMVQKPACYKDIEEIEDIVINPYCDVDGATAMSLGLIMKSDSTCNKSLHEPATPKGIMNLLNYYDIELESKNVLIINRSSMLGKPLAMMMLNKDATVTVAHSKTENLKELCQNADIVVTGISNPEVFKPDWFKDKAVIIDVSTNVDENGKTSGDVKKEYYEELSEKKNCKLTPVPGGVGPMTVASLMENILIASDLQ